MHRTHLTAATAAIAMALCSTAAAMDYPPYTGAKDDFDYLRSYVEHVLAKPPGFFETATVENTDVLRDFVHHANYDFLANGHPDTGCIRDDIGCMFRERVGENCGFMTISLMAIFEAFGFDTRGYDTIDGTLSGPFKYRDSHVFPEVVIPALGQYVIQDPTFDLSPESCGTKKRLSFDQMQTSFMVGEPVCFAQMRPHPKASNSGVMKPKVLASLIDDYYGASRLATITFDGPKWTRNTWFGIVDRPPRPAPSTTAFERKVADCLDEDDLAACVDATYGTHEIKTTDLDGTLTGRLLEYSTTDGQVYSFDPVTKQRWGFDYSQILYVYVSNARGDPGDYRRFAKPVSLRLSGGRLIKFPDDKPAAIASEATAQ